MNWIKHTTDKEPEGRVGRPSRRRSRNRVRDHYVNFVGNFLYWTNKRATKPLDQFRQGKCGVVI